MNILLIRHGKAEDRTILSLSAKKDGARALTETGRRDMRKAAKGLRKFSPDIDMLVTSPLVRARETAGIVARVFGVRDVVEQVLLSPGESVEALCAWLREQPVQATVALVGHEPELSRLAGLLIGGRPESLVCLKKGACALIEFDDRPAAGRGRLAWLLQPGQLRRLD